MYVKQIYSNSPAALSDLKTGDVITAINGIKISSMDELNKIKNILELLKAYNVVIKDEISLLT